MKKEIFKNLYNEITVFFIVCSLTLSLIVWILQAVNFLDIVSEDGHSMATYFAYSTLNLPKILSKLLLLSFFISLFYILVNYEDKNQILIFWINGITKKQFLNKIIYLGILYCLLSFLLSYLIVPYTQNKARSFIRQSNLDFFPALIKPRTFVDTVENLTIFLDYKKDNNIKKILIKDDSKSNSQLIIAKAGEISTNTERKLINLSNGVIVDFTENKKLKTFRFESSFFDLNKFKTKTTITPKVQELSSQTILKCLFELKKNLGVQKYINELNCQKSFFKNLIQEIYKRTILPIYFPLISIIACFVIIKSNNNKNYKFYKIKVFLSGILFIIISQISVNLISKDLLIGIVTISIPFLIMIITYLFFMNLIKKNS